MAQQDNPEVAEAKAQFAIELRKLLISHDVTQRELTRRADQQGFSLPKSTLSDALGGKRFPRLDVVFALVRVCTRNEEGLTEWRQKWIAAAEKIRLPARSMPAQSVPRAIGLRPTPSAPIPPPAPDATTPPVPASASASASAQETTTTSTDPEKAATLARLSKLVSDSAEKTKIRIGAALELAGNDHVLDKELYPELLKIESTLAAGDFDNRVDLIDCYRRMKNDHSDDVSRIGWHAIHIPSDSAVSRMGLASKIGRLGGHHRVVAIKFLNDWLHDEPDPYRQIFLIQRLAALDPDRRQHFIQLATQMANDPKSKESTVKDANDLIDELSHDFAFERLVRIWG